MSAGVSAMRPCHSSMWISLLGNGESVTLKEVESWSLNNVDLVVLNACETGLGDILGNGSEILGFGYPMQRAGARAAIASLWSVDDSSPSPSRKPGKSTAMTTDQV